MKPGMYELHYELEREHWWFVGRRRVVLDQMARALGDDAAGLRIMDIGCGTGGMLAHLGRFGSVTGVDPSPHAARLAARAGLDIRHGALPGPLPEPAGSFDAITLLDVVEHIDAEHEALRAVWSALKPGGLLVCTVPAFQWLWSEHDVRNEHRRRYTRATLSAALQRAGFEVQRISYFNFFLFTPVAAVRLAQRILPPRGEQAVGRVPRPVNSVLAALFGGERALLRVVSLPFGVSLLALARRPGAEPVGTP